MDKKIRNRRTCFPISSSTTVSSLPRLASNMQFLLRLGFKLEYPLYNRVYILSGNAFASTTSWIFPYSVQPKVFSIRLVFSVWKTVSKRPRFVRGKEGKGCPWMLKWSLRRMRILFIHLSVSRVFFLYARTQYPFE